MFPRIITTRKNGKTYRYLVLIQGYRDKGRVRQKVVGNLGNIDNYSKNEIRRLIRLLADYIGEDVGQVQDFVPTRVMELGATLAINAVWDELGIDEILAACLKEARIKSTISPYIKVLVSKRLLDPSSDLDIGEWCWKLYWPEGSPPVDPEGYHRALDLLGRLCPFLEQIMPAKLAEHDLISAPLYEIIIRSEIVEEQGNDGPKRDRFGSQSCFVKYLCSKDGFPLGYRIITGPLKVKRDLLREKWLAFRVIPGEVQPILIFPCEHVCFPGLKILRTAKKPYVAVTRHRYCPRRQEQMQDPVQHLTLDDTDLWVSSPSAAPEGLTYLICRNSARVQDNREGNSEEESALEVLRRISGRLQKLSPEKIEEILETLLTKEERESIIWDIDEDGRFVVFPNTGKFREEHTRDIQFFLESNALNQAGDLVNAYQAYAFAENHLGLIRQLVNHYPAHCLSDNQLRGLFCTNIISGLILNYLEMKIRDQNREFRTGHAALGCLRDLKTVELSMSKQKVLVSTPATERQISLLQTLGVKESPCLSGKWIKYRAGEPGAGKQ